MAMRKFPGKIAVEIYEERGKQIAKGFTYEIDDEKELEDWCDDIVSYAIWARQMARMYSPTKYRKRMKQIAVLAIAACESFDRRASS